MEKLKTLLLSLLQTTYNKHPQFQHPQQRPSNIIFGGLLLWHSQMKNYNKF